MRVAVLMAVLAGGTLHAGELELKPDTLKAWDEYVHAVEVALHQHPDERSRQTARVRAGEIVVSAVGEPNPRHVPSGLIHDWVGAVFIPKARIADVMSVVRDYSRYREMYKPGILDGRLLRQTGLRDEFVVTLRSTSYFKKTAIECSYEASYFRVDAARWYSISNTTQVQEIDDYGGPHEHKLPVNRGNGYIWRLYRTARLEERDGGVFLDVEAIALSRDVPVAIRWIVSPIIRREAREMLTGWLERTRAAVGSRVAFPGPRAGKASKKPLATNEHE